MIAEDPAALSDVSACAAKIAMMTKPLNSVRLDQENSLSYVEPYFSGFGASALICWSPLEYVSNWHRSIDGTKVTDY